MKYVIDKAYSVMFSNVRYVESIPLCTTPYNPFVIEIINKEVHNRSLSFSYYTKNVQQSYIHAALGTVNKNKLFVAGIQIPAKTALLSSVLFERCDALLDNADACIWKVNIVIELEHEKKLLTDKIPLRSFYFVNPVTKTTCPIQFSTDPSKFADKVKYPAAYHVGGGFGFFDENRHDLNVTEPMFVTSQGSLVNDPQNIVYMDVPLHEVFDWSCLHLPDIVGV